MMRILLLFLLIFSFKPQAFGQAATAETKGGKQKNWRVMADVQHVPIMREDQESYTDVVAIGDYFLNDKHRLRVMQAGSKLYSKYDSEYEFQASDTRLYHYYNFESKPLGFGYIWRNDIAIPISDLSQQDDLVTRFTTTMFMNRMIGGKTFISLMPFARYNWYKFRTSPGGRLLPLYTFGASALVSYSIIGDLSINGTAFYSIEGTNSSQYDSNFVQKEQGIYSFSVALNYQLMKELSLYGAYSSGPANYINQGRYEVYLYDQDSSRLGVGMTAIF